MDQPLLLPSNRDINEEEEKPLSFRHKAFLFLEAQTPAGLLFEYFSIFLIALSVICFVLNTEYGFRFVFQPFCFGTTSPGIPIKQLGTV